MALTQILVLVAFLITLYLITAITSYRRLSHIPGPKTWGWSLIPLWKLHSTGDMYQKLGQLATEYGPLVRIAPNYLLCADPEVHRRMSAARSPYKRSKWYRAAARLTPGIDNVLSECDETRHTERRRRMAAGYSGKENPRLEPDIDACILDFVDLIERKYISSNGESKPMEFARKVQFFTSDVMSQLSFDAKFHDLRDDEDNYGYINELETVYPNIYSVGVLPGLMDFLTATGILGLVTRIQSKEVGLGRVQAICQAQVAARFGRDGKVKEERQDMLASFIRHGLTKEDLAQESILQLAAGSDTTATGIRTTMLNILKHPRVYKKLMAEIDGAIREGRITSNPVEVISESTAKQMPYLQAIIKEGLRWLPPIVGLLPKEVPRGGDTIAGYFVPGGTAIAYSWHALHHSPSLFGPDQDSFRPERWLHTSQSGDEPSWTKLAQLERNHDLLFGHGKYQCLGKNVAFMELNKILVELLRRFEFALVDPVDGEVDVCESRNYGIHFQRGIWVTVQRRPCRK